MISNVACFCCNIVSFIVILYSAIFYSQDTVLLNSEGAALYISWLVGYVLGLSLAAGQAVILNHKVSIGLHAFTITTMSAEIKHFATKIFIDFLLSSEPIS